MLTYSFEEKGKDSLYQYLYKQIKNDILSFQLAPGEKLPSKRALAKHLNISTITVENAYSQLVAEGYLYSVPKSGYYVCDLSLNSRKKENTLPSFLPKQSEDTSYFADFVNNSTAQDNFPFSICRCF